MAQNSVGKKPYKMTRSIRTLCYGKGEEGKKKKREKQIKNLSGVNLAQLSERAKSICNVIDFRTTESFDLIYKSFHETKN